MKDYSNYRPLTQDKLLWSARKIFEEQLKANGEDIVIDGSKIKGLVTEHTNPLNQDKEDRKLKCSDSVNIKKGSSVRYEDKDWLVITNPKKREVYILCKILPCTNTLTFQDPTNPSIIHEIPCILADKTSVYSDGINEGKYLTLADDQISITMPDNELIDSKYLNKRFIFNHDKMYVFEVSKIDKLTQPGLMIVVMKKNDYNPATDRLDLNIANYIESSEQPDPEPVGYSITIEGADEIRLGEVQTYIANVYADGVLVEKVVNWSVDDTTRVTIAGTTNSTCDLKASEKFDAMGEVKLTAKLVDDETMVGDKWIEVIGLW